MCSTGPFQYRWLKGFIYSSCYYYHQIGSIHLPQCYHIFPWLCVWDVCYIIFCYLLHTHSGKIGNLSSLLLCSLWWVQIIGYVLSWRSYWFVCTLHHLIIIIVQTYLNTLSLQNACQKYFIECVSKIRHILSVIHCIIRGAVCFQFTHFLVMIERIYILCLNIIIKSEVWTITHCLGFGHDTMVCAAYLFAFLFTTSRTAKQHLFSAHKRTLHASHICDWYIAWQSFVTKAV